jgi:hypothetical protein
LILVIRFVFINILNVFSFLFHSFSVTPDRHIPGYIIKDLADISVLTWVKFLFLFVFVIVKFLYGYGNLIRNTCDFCIFILLINCLFHSIVVPILIPKTWPISIQRNQEWGPIGRPLIAKSTGFKLHLRPHRRQCLRRQCRQWAREWRPKTLKSE